MLPAAPVFLGLVLESEREGERETASLWNIGKNSKVFVSLFYRFPEETSEGEKYGRCTKSTRGEKHEERKGDEKLGREKAHVHPDW